MFSKAQLGRVWWPVTIATLDEHGTTHEREILLQFAPLSRKEWRARNEEALIAANELNARIKAEREAEASGEKSSTDANAVVGDLLGNFQRRMDQHESNIADLITRTHDWRKVTDDAGESLPFDREHFAALLEQPWFWPPVFKAFEACSNGEAVRKNSSPGPAGAPGPVQS